ncbi:MAG TPA: DNA adenine methylase [Polyangiaceae bacterium]|nr:DNA adenine methylase [Polyangiaceae bacterium]
MARARPFLKWAGGKSQLLAPLKACVPATYRRYFEPFLGGGALFFDLLPKKSQLSDVNAEIVDCYVAVRDQVGDLVRALKDHRHDSEHYYAVRDTDPATLSPVERAARTIFLNKTGYNGLYRVNRSGKFNVPFGRYAKPNFCDQKTLEACSAALANAEILVRDFEDAVGKASAGDFVYFDPPYVPLSRTATFTAYAPNGFGPGEQRRLSEVFGRLSARQVSVVLSNSNVPAVRDLYGDYRISTVKASRAINSKAARRGPVSEVIVRSEAKPTRRRAKA